MVNISDDSFLLAVKFCMIRLVNLEPAKHEEAAINDRLLQKESAYIYLYTLQVSGE